MNKLFHGAIMLAITGGPVDAMTLCDGIEFSPIVPGASMTAAFPRVYQKRHYTARVEYANVTGYVEIRGSDDSVEAVYLRQNVGGRLICTRFLQLPLSISDGTLAELDTVTSDDVER